MSTPALSYAPPAPHRIRNRAMLITAYVCGILPLVIGVGTAGLYLLTYQRSLEMVGLLTIVGGSVLVFLGLLMWLAFAFGRQPIARRTWWLHSGCSLVLLLANIPACALCLNVRKVWRFNIGNTTTAPVTSVVLTSTNGTRTVGPIAPGSSRTIYWIPDVPGGTVSITATTPAGPMSGTLDYYAEPGYSGQDAVVVIGPAGVTARTK